MSWRRSFLWDNVSICIVSSDVLEFSQIWCILSYYFFQLSSFSSNPSSFGIPVNLIFAHLMMSPGSHRTDSFSYFFFYSSLTELFQSIYVFSDNWFYLLFGLICCSCTLLHFSFCLLNSSDSEFLLVLFKDFYLFIKFLILFSCPDFTELCFCVYLELTEFLQKSSFEFFISYTALCAFEFSYRGLLLYFGGDVFTWYFMLFEALHCCFHTWTSICSNLCHFMVGHNLLWFYLNLGFSPTLYGCTCSIFLLLFVSEFLIFYIFSGSYKSPVYYWKLLPPSPEGGATANGCSLSLAHKSQPFFFFLRGLPVYWTLLLQLCSELNIRRQTQSVGKFELGPWSTGDTFVAGEVLPVAHRWDFY